MNKYVALVKHDRDRQYQHSGIATGETPLHAAAAVAVSAKGYDEDEHSRLELVDRFVQDGFQFKLLKLAENEDGSPIEIREQDFL